MGECERGETVGADEEKPCWFEVGVDAGLELEGHGELNLGLVLGLGRV